MDASTRRTRFEERVRIEREFLVPINARFGTLAPLAGMTGAAINSWALRAAASPGGVDVARVAVLLREAAARAELLADNSRDVFAPAGRTSPDGLAALRAMLDDELRVGDPA
ncbi:hypothetical protein [uncultured Sphingomonas sp.]|uniref:hypothetical protein n=1 Tax=uncultured Sphingomonas sp. TaxID=158754 RepID=UPI0025F075C8|nr:hypothetical protein [uncultured Sphingomonas sp.]